MLAIIKKMYICRKIYQIFFKFLGYHSVQAGNKGSREVTESQWMEPARDRLSWPNVQQKINSMEDLLDFMSSQSRTAKPVSPRGMVSDMIILTKRYRFQYQCKQKYSRIQNLLLFLLVHLFLKVRQKCLKSFRLTLYSFILYNLYFYFA